MGAPDQAQLPRLDKRDKCALAQAPKRRLLQRRRQLDGRHLPLVLVI